MNNDVALEILFNLPVRSLLRFRAVCKFWCDVIDSPHFRKWRTELFNKNDDDEADDAVYLQFTFPRRARKVKLSSKLLDNGKCLNSHDLPFKSTGLSASGATNSLRIAGAVKGLICISSHSVNQSICICNPFLGQFKILPLSPLPSSHKCGLAICHISRLGFDEEYKVVQLFQCYEHKYCCAGLYSRRTNSWKELAIDQGLETFSHIKSLCNNGSFAHWEGWTREQRRIILRFDMKNEVFRVITISGDVWIDGKYEIFAKDECSFLLFMSSRKWIKVYESRGEGSELEGNWNYVMSFGPLLYGELPIWRSDDYEVSKDLVVLKNHYFGNKEGVWYDYHARKFIGRSLVGSVVLYEGSFISP